MCGSVEGALDDAGLIWPYLCGFHPVVISCNVLCAGVNYRERQCGGASVGQGITGPAHYGCFMSSEPLSSGRR